MTFGYNADVNSSLATNFMRIENVSSAILNALANKRWQAEVKHPNVAPLILTDMTPRQSIGPLYS
jgi:hypothetical protein